MRQPALNSPSTNERTARFLKHRARLLYGGDYEGQSHFVRVALIVTIVVLGRGFSGSRRVQSNCGGEEAEQHPVPLGIHGKGNASTRLDRMLIEYWVR